MAKLVSKNLSWVIDFRNYQHGWVEYDMQFLWKDKPIINDDIMKKDGEYWSSRKPNSFLLNDDEKDYLISTIKEVLATNKSDYWQPIEPDCTVAIYYDDSFPFLQSHYIRIYRSDEERLKHEAAIELKKSQGPQPNDWFTVIVQTDCYQFEDEDTYQGDGVALHMSVYRSQLEQFVAELESEYELFKVKFKTEMETEPKYVTYDSETGTYV